VHCARVLKIPTLEYTPEEQSARLLQPETVTRAAKQFTTSGCLFLARAFPESFIQTLREAFFARYEAYFNAGQFAEAKPVGEKRIQTTVDFSPPFNSAELYANPLVLPILQALLGENLFMGIFGGVTSLPGAELQHYHRDNPLLFSDLINSFLPPYAINLFVPLIEFNEVTGTTRLFPGTHLKPSTDAPISEGVDPVVPPGSCLLMDYRLYHQGTPNCSPMIRPMLFCAYHRPWFKDYVNHRSLPFLTMSDLEHRAIPEAYRRMFGWMEHYRTGLY